MQQLATMLPFVSIGGVDKIYFAKKLKPELMEIEQRHLVTYYLWGIYNGTYIYDNYLYIITYCFKILSPHATAHL